jgi:cholesterol transport system auxiliary component
MKACDLKKPCTGSGSLVRIFAFGLAAMVALASCGFLGSGPRKDAAIYELDLPHNGEESAPEETGTACAVLLVSSPLSAPGLASSSMVYTREEGRLESYADNRWVDTPGRMLSPLIIRVLSKSGLFTNVVVSPAPIDAGFRLETEVLSLKQVFSETGSFVELAVRASLFDLNRRDLVFNDTLRVEEPAPTPDPRGGVTAASRATGKLLDQLTDALRAALSQRPCVADGGAG